MRRLTTTYNNRGLPELLTSWSTTSGSTSTDIVNQVQQDYNDFEQLTSDWQEHSGAVDTAAGAGQSLRVQYAYASGVASGSPTNFVRPTELTYPDGRTIVYTYGGNAAIDYHINRMKTIKEGSTTGDGLVQYVFLGMNRHVRANYWIPETRLDLWGGTVGTYTGLDQFNRPTNCKWIDTGANPDVDIVDLEYGYNRNSIPTYRADDLAASSDNYDELYGRDGLDRLDNFQRGTLNGGKTAITTLAFEQDWSLDQVANWDAFNEDTNGDGADNLVQTRTHNFSNEVTGITNTTGGAWNAPTYDSAGNTTQCPAPDDPATSTSDRKLTYDAWNRVVKATDNQGTPNTLAEYAYDARGFRVLRKGYTSGTHDATYHDYFTTDWQCIEERLDDPSNEDPPALDRQYVWGGRYIDELVQRKRDTTGNGVLNEELFAMNDRQFNVVGLTDETGAVVQRMTLTAYGEVTFLTSSYGSSTSTKDWRHVFQGLRTDDGTGFIDNRRRPTDSLLGRFLTRDPLGYPDGMNAYAAYHVLWGGIDPIGLKENKYYDFDPGVGKLKELEPPPKDERMEEVGGRLFETKGTWDPENKTWYFFANTVLEGVANNCKRRMTCCKIKVKGSLKTIEWWAVDNKAKKEEMREIKIYQEHWKRFARYIEAAKPVIGVRMPCEVATPMVKIMNALKWVYWGTAFAKINIQDIKENGNFPQYRRSLRMALETVSTEKAKFEKSMRELDQLLHDYDSGKKVDCCKKEKD